MSSGEKYDVTSALRDVQAALMRELERLPAPLASPCRRLVTAGGKRLRPRLVLMSAQCAQRPLDDRVVDLATAVELLHLATLVHDDLLDDAHSRRGVPTVNAVEGHAFAVLVGDALIGASSRLATEVSAPSGLLVQETLIELCAGQAVEAEARWDSSLTERAALQIAEAKTGTLLGTACRIATTVGPETHGRLAPALDRFGRAFGTSLQLLDDVLDLTSSSALLGKPTGTDFAVGTVTLPAVVAMSRHPELRGLLKSDPSQLERVRALSLIRDGVALAASVRQARRHAESAASSLWDVADLADSGALQRLAASPMRYLRQQLDLVLPGYRHRLSDDGTAGGPVSERRETV